MIPMPFAQTLKLGKDGIFSVTSLITFDISGGVFAVITPLFNEDTAEKHSRATSICSCKIDVCAARSISLFMYNS